MNIIAAVDPALTSVGIQWGNLIFNIDTFSLAATSAFELIILIVAILYTQKLKKFGYRLHLPLMVSFNLFMVFEILTKIMRIGNLLTNTETFAQSSWSLPLTMCRVANATTALVFLIQFMLFIWAVKFEPVNDPNKIVK